MHLTMGYGILPFSLTLESGLVLHPLIHPFTSIRIHLQDLVKTPSPLLDLLAPLTSSSPRHTVQPTAAVQLWICSREIRRDEIQDQTWTKGHPLDRPVSTITALDV